MGSTTGQWGPDTSAAPPPSTGGPLPPPPGPGWWTDPPTGRPTGWAPPPPPVVPPEPVERRRPPREPDPAPGQLLALALLAAVALELGIRGGLANALVVLGLGLVVVGLVTRRRLRQRRARLLALAALVPLAFLAVWSSPWLTATNLIAGGVLAGAALAFSRSGSPSDTTLLRLGARLAGCVPQAWSAPRVLQPLVPEVSQATGRRVARVATAALICVPVLIIVVALMSAADAVFAGMLTPDISLGPLSGHVALLSLFAVGAVCLIGSAASDHADPAPRGRFGVLEIATMLTLTAGVLALFVVAQLVALTSAGHRLVAESGLTPAMYARTGFFQLCWATGLILGLLALIRSLAAPTVMAARLVRVLAALVPILALGLVVVSLRRMALYDHAFGLTMLRLWVMGAATWMGVVLVLIAIHNAGVVARREWVLGAATAAALALILLADVVNPEAFVAHHNLARARRGSELDAGYLAQLSDDAAGTLTAEYERADPATRVALRSALHCTADPSGATTLNLAVWRAEHHRRTPCPDLAHS